MSIDILFVVLYHFIKQKHHFLIRDIQGKAAHFYLEKLRQSLTFFIKNRFK